MGNLTLFTYDYAMISDVPKLVDLVRERPILWDKPRSDFFNKDKRADTWQHMQKSSNREAGCRMQRDAV